MRILLDEDTPVQLVEILRRLLPGHKVDHLQELKWKGKKDRLLLADARKAGYEVFVTNDSNQLDDPDETDAIKKSKLHHVRYGQRQKGLRGLALSMGAVISSMPGMIDELEQVSTQQLVHIAGLDPRGRYKIVDPKRDPPRYWR